MLSRCGRHGWIVGSALVAGLGLLGASLSGCQNYSGGPTTARADATPPASPVQHRLLQNIPVPVGFHLNRDRSTARASGQIRFASCEFDGHSSADQVAAFYTRHMPSAKFVLKKESLEAGESRLEFQSDREECEVRIRETSNGTKLVINLGPLPKGTAERNSKSAARR